MSYADVNGILMYHEEQGQGQPLVLLHGGTGPHPCQRRLEQAVARLAACYRAISVEHRDHGRLAEAPLGYDPIIEVEAVFTAALQKAVVRSNSDLLMRWSAIRDVRRGGA